MSNGIYLSDGSFKSFIKEDLQMEIATRQNANFIHYSWLGQLPDPDPILRKRGDDVRILNDLLAEEQVMTAITSRKNRVLNSQEYGFSIATFKGGNADEITKLVHNRLTKDLERLNMRSLISAILDAPFFGLVPLEIIWEAKDSWWSIKDIIAKPYYWFAFDENNQPFFKGDYYGTIKKEYLPTGKFIFVTHNATYDNPYGIRLLSRCLWPVTFKHGGLQFYAKFIEKYGVPFVIGKASAGATREEKALIASNLARMVEDAVAVIPKGAEVDLITPPSSTTSMHEDFLSRQDRAISKILMGQTLTLEMEGKNNSQAAATTHQDVANDIAKADKSLVCDAMNEIAWIYTILNVGENIPAPLFSFIETKNLQERALLDKELYALGVRFNHQHFVDEYGLKDDEFILIDTNQTPSFSQASSFVSSFSNTVKENPHYTGAKQQKAFDGAIKELLPEAIQANNAFLDELQKLLQQATSYEEMEYSLIELLSSKMEITELEDFLATALTKAELFGLFSNEHSLQGK